MGMTLYRKISDANRLKYGTEFERVLRIIINQYSDRTHFIYEILQNAEDAGATHIKFHLERERLIIYHNGRPFDEKDIEGVCGIANGTKEDGTRIGHFGIGFKSVYCYTERPHIYSGAHRFVIINQLFPEEVGPITGLADSETCMILPFDKKDVSAEIAYQEIRNALTKKISAESLLMLTNIADVEIRIAGYSDIIAISKERYPLDPAAYPDNVFSLSVQATYTNVSTGKQREKDADYLFFTDGNKEAAAIIFNVEGKELQPIKNSKVYAYFPTAKEAHQNFYIHAPFDTTPARDNFKEGAEYGKHNILLVQNIGNLIWFAFTWMRDHKYLSALGFRNVFPIYKYEEGDILFELYQNSIDIIAEEAIIPTSITGEFRNLSDICFPESGNIVDVFDTDDMRRLTRRRKASWIAREFTTDSYSEIRSFLSKNFKLERLDWKDLVLKLDAAFLKEKQLGWMEQLFLRIEGYCTPRFGSDSHHINVSRIPFVRTNTGDQICARDDSGKLLVYLNNPDICRYRIEESFINNETIYSFYQRALGIPEYNVEQETVENILPKYVKRTPTFKTGNPLRENIEDLKIIKDAIYINSSILEKITDKYIVTDGSTWYMPSQLYIRSDDFRTGYTLVESIIQIHYLAEDYFSGTFLSLKLDDDFFKKIGCNFGIRILDVSRKEYLRAAWQYEGAQVQMDLENRIFSKHYISKKLNWAFNYEGFPAVFKNITKEKSLAIARFLNPNMEKFNIQGELVGADDQHFSGKNVDNMTAYSMLGLQLCFIEWIFVKEDPNPHRPVDIDAADILDDYNKYAKRLIAALPFKEVKNALSDWLNETIDDKGDRDLIKRLMANPDELVKIAKAKARSEAKDASRKSGKSIIDLLGEGDKKQAYTGKKPDGGISPISDRGKEKREKKLDDVFKASLDQRIQVAPAVRGLSFTRRECSPEERKFLEQEYSGVCQICQKQILKYNDEPYFEAINIIKTSNLDDHLLPTMQYGWNSLCLCPNCAAEYNNCSKKISTIYEQAVRAEVESGSDEAIRIQIEMPEGRKRFIAYSPRHMIALQRALKIFTKVQDN